MSEYNIQMNKYNALNAEYDQLYPKPMKHANTHAKDGSDPITPASIGAYTKGETDTLLAKKLHVHANNECGLDCNAFIEDGRYQVQGDNVENSPYNDGYSHFFIDVFKHNDDWIRQVAYRVNDHGIYTRSCFGGNWNAWKQITTETELDTKVSKSGDTMTGDLNTGLSDGIHGKIGSFYSSNDNNNCQFMDTYNPANNSGVRLQIWANKNDPNITAAAGLWIYLNGAFNHLGNLLHTGNAQSLGYPKIAIGSYVGTGTYSSANANSLTFDFEPKVVIIVQNSHDNFPGTVFIRGQTLSGTIGENYISNSDLTVGWSGNTVSWYTGNSSYGARAQLNISGNTYFYVALG